MGKKDGLGLGATQASAPPTRASDAGGGGAEATESASATIRELS
jgi:hypothetical protein